MKEQMKQTKTKKWMPRYTPPETPDQLYIENILAALWCDQGINNCLSCNDDNAVDSHYNRVLARLGITPAAGETAASLRANMIRHGQEICTPVEPQCFRCPLRGFCADYRNRASRQWRQDKSKPSCVDLFSGAGGASVGISRPVEWGNTKQAADTPTMRIALAAEIDKWARKTYAINHPEIPVDRLLMKDLTAEDAVAVVQKAVAGEPNLVLVFGGPPCQPFSLVGSTGRKTAISKGSISSSPTYSAFRDIVKALRTRFFVMENVPGMLAAFCGSARQDIIDDFSDMYATKAICVEANNHGVPQFRRRVLVVGVLKADCAILANQALDFMVERLMRPLERAYWSATFGEAVSDLPPVEPCQGQEFRRHTLLETPSISAYQSVIRNNCELLCNHVARYNNQRDLERYAILKPGEVVLRGHGASFAKYRRQVWDAPARTLIAKLEASGNTFIHPQQVRSITVREAARLQSFPDDFIFAGPMTAQFRQIGNAVPPLLGARIRTAVLETLERFFLT